MGDTKHLTYSQALAKYMDDSLGFNENVIIMGQGVDDFKGIWGTTLDLHKKYGEATAVLAGNSLLTLAFEIISNQKNLISIKHRDEIINLLANCSGHTGIAGGQELDLKFENKRKNLTQIIDMQKKKTGKLFNFCLQSVALISNKNPKRAVFTTLFF